MVRVPRAGQELLPTTALPALGGVLRADLTSEGGGQRCYWFARSSRWKQAPVWLQGIRAVRDSVVCGSVAGQGPCCTHLSSAFRNEEESKRMVPLPSVFMCVRARAYVCVHTHPLLMVDVRVACVLAVAQALVGAG